jgi:hypothetical protein
VTDAVRRIAAEAYRRLRNPAEFLFGRSDSVLIVGLSTQNNQSVVPGSKYCHVIQHSYVTGNDATVPAAGPPSVGSCIQRRPPRAAVTSCVSLTAVQAVSHCSSRRIAERHRRSDGCCRATYEATVIQRRDPSQVQRFGSSPPIGSPRYGTSRSATRAFGNVLWLRPTQCACSKTITRRLPLASRNSLAQ